MNLLQNEMCKKAQMETDKITMGFERGLTMGIEKNHKNYEIR